MEERINYYPVFDNGQVKAVAFVLALFSSFMLLALFNHAPRYSGLLPMEFWLAPVILVLLLLTNVTIEKSAGGFVVSWRMFGICLQRKQYEGLIAVLDGKNIYLSGLHEGQKKLLFISFLKERNFEKLQKFEIRIVEQD